MSEMVERVTKALSAYFDGLDYWPHTSENDRDDLRGAASAVIKAMHEPTGTMIVSGLDADGNTSNAGVDSVVAMYEAMLLQALI